MAAEQLLSELAEAACYPERPRQIEILQTHLSVVCITDTRVYKLKKAVTLPFVDFAELSARRQACRDEVRLNRRLCEDVYLGTAGLRRIDGRLAFAELGDDAGPDDLDVAVVMRRLPQQRMLDQCVAAGTASASDLEALAARIAAFHATADRSPEITATGDPDRLAALARDNFTELAALPQHGLPAELLQAAGEASERAFAAALPRLQERAHRGRIVDGHGDLHARNICMTDPPTVYDCIEFEAGVPLYGDVATEVAFTVDGPALPRRGRSSPTLFVRRLRRDVSGDVDRRRACCRRSSQLPRDGALPRSPRWPPPSPSCPTTTDRDAARASARYDHLWLASALA